MRARAEPIFPTPRRVIPSEALFSGVEGPASAFRLVPGHEFTHAASDTKCLWALATAGRLHPRSARTLRARAEPPRQRSHLAGSRRTPRRRSHLEVARRTTPQLTRPTRQRRERGPVQVPEPRASKWTASAPGSSVPIPFLITNHQPPTTVSSSKQLSFSFPHLAMILSVNPGFNLAPRNERRETRNENPKTTPRLPSQ
jgi:hypothetical protein